MATTTTYPTAYGTNPSVAGIAKHKGLFHRFLDRLIEARMRRADEFIRQHSHLIPHALEQRADWRLTERSEDSLPFIR
jgi:hypothetical protein